LKIGQYVEKLEAKYSGTFFRHGELLMNLDGTQRSYSSAKSEKVPILEKIFVT